MTGIQWTDETWNPVTGCNKVSLGCQNCYAEAMTYRFTKAFPDGFKLTLKPERLQQPMRWRKPRLVFVNSMSDLFHENIPLEYIEKVFEVIKNTPQHTYQILTKRDQRLLEFAPQLQWHPNIWIGVSVEAGQYVSRVDSLRQITQAKVRFLSCEPLLSDLELNLQGIDWVIVGGESGTGHRPIKAEWVENIHQQCLAHQIPFFFKQWGGRTPKAGGRTFKNKIWDEMPHCHNN